MTEKMIIEEELGILLSAFMMKTGEYTGITYGFIGKGQEFYSLYLLGEGFKNEIIKEFFLVPAEGEKNVYRAIRSLYLLSEDYLKEEKEQRFWCSQVLHCAMTGWKEEDMSNSFPVPKGKDGFLELLQKARGQLIKFKNIQHSYLYYRYYDGTKIGSLCIEEILGDNLSIDEAEKLLAEYGWKIVTEE